jgi:hypothetical protein
MYSIMDSYVVFFLIVDETDQEPISYFFISPTLLGKNGHFYSYLRTYLRRIKTLVFKKIANFLPKLEFLAPPPPKKRKRK